MSETLKVLGQANPAADTLTDLYTAPVGGAAVVALLRIANRGGSATTYRVAVAVGGAADSVVQYLAYDESLPANSSAEIRRIVMGSGDVLRVRVAAQQVSFNAHGVEVI